MNSNTIYDILIIGNREIYTTLITGAVAAVPTLSAKGVVGMDIETILRIIELLIILEIVRNIKK